MKFRAWETRFGGNAHLYANAEQAYRDVLSFLFAIRGGARTHVVIPAAIPKSFLRASSAIGCRLRFYDLDSSYCPSLPSLEDTVSRNTVAILVIHRFGISEQMAEIASIAKRSGAVLIEDFSFVLAGTYRGQSLGTFEAMSISDLREMLGLSEGGLLRVGDPFRDFCPRYEHRNMWSPKNMLKQTLKYCYIRATGSADPLGVLRGDEDESMVETPQEHSCVERPSRMLEFRLRRNDFERLSTLRRNAFCYLGKHLPVTPCFEPLHRTLSGAVTPLAFPILVHGRLRHRLQEELVRRGIMVETGLPLAPFAPSSARNNRMFTSLLEIPLRGIETRARLKATIRALEDVSRAVSILGSPIERRAA